jgi:hypothetical protein
MERASSLVRDDTGPVAGHATDFTLPPLRWAEGYRVGQNVAIAPDQRCVA